MFEMGIQHCDQVYGCLDLPCCRKCPGYHCLGIQCHICGIGVTGVQEVGWPEACHCQCHHHHHPHLHLHLHLHPQMYLPYQHSWLCLETQVWKVIDQGWVWGRVGDGNVGGMLAWGGGPGRDHGQTSVELCNNEAFQGLSEGDCQNQ